MSCSKKWTCQKNVDMLGSRVICMSPDLVSLVGPLPRLYYYVTTKACVGLLKKTKQLQVQPSTIPTFIHPIFKQEWHNTIGWNSWRLVSRQIRFKLRHANCGICHDTTIYCLRSYNVHIHILMVEGPISRYIYNVCILISRYRSCLTREAMPIGFIVPQSMHWVMRKCD